MKKKAVAGKFVVYTAREGLEDEPKVKVVPKTEARRRFAETGGEPVSGKIYGTRWDHFHVGAVVGNFTALEDALKAALDAAVNFRAEVDRAMAEELTGAEDEDERRQIEEYHAGHREVILEFESDDRTSLVPAEQSVASLAHSKRQFREFVRRVKRMTGQR